MQFATKASRNIPNRRGGVKRKNAITTKGSET